MLEDGEIRQENDTELIPEAEFESRSPEDDTGKSLMGRVTGSYWKMENQQVRSPLNEEDQQSQINPIINKSPRNMEDKMEVNDVDNVDEPRTHQVLFENIGDLLPKGGFRPFPNMGVEGSVEPNRTLDLEMDPNGSYLKRRKIRQAMMNHPFNSDQLIPDTICPK